MPSPETTIGIANADQLAGGAVLLMGFEDAALAREMAARTDRLVVFSPDLRAARAHAGFSVEFGPWLLDGGPFDSVVVRLPKETERLRMHLAMARALVSDGGSVAIVGHNEAGIRSAGRHLDELVGEHWTLDYRYHCRIETASAEVAARAFAPDEWRTISSVEAGSWRAAIVSYPGVFSHGRLDDGTLLLLGALPPGDGGRALDVGCGNGVIAAWLASHGYAAEAVDVDALAIRAATETLEPFGARAFASDAFSDAAGPYDLIATNPPFHTGVRTTTDVAERLIAEAPARLSPGGELWLVGNRFLDYGTPIRAAFNNVTVAAENNRFRVWRARQ